ncbi:hypothetical protein CYMTET_39391 [Cymbomonas tetramitiformis]|uniref:Uncharacterized protein n=1 Tax=Cymbomonas tetramitiformis TaxID=36881 RepID=A0AAE0CCA4_9CHLO|nr:hypothetical protein CYMTET_39391 [Cymbomonas tetramitiformis]|eukprot:gene634-1066_t
MTWVDEVVGDALSGNVIALQTLVEEFANEMYGYSSDVDQLRVAIRPRLTDLAALLEPTQEAEVRGRAASVLAGFISTSGEQDSADANDMRSVSLEEARAAVAAGALPPLVDLVGDQSLATQWRLYSARALGSLSDVVPEDLIANGAAGPIASLLRTSSSSSASVGTPGMEFALGLQTAEAQETALSVLEALVERQPGVVHRAPGTLANLVDFLFREAFPYGPQASSATQGEVRSAPDTSTLLDEPACKAVVRILDMATASSPDAVKQLLCVRGIEALRGECHVSRLSEKAPSPTVQLLEQVLQRVEKLAVNSPDGGRDSIACSSEAKLNPDHMIGDDPGQRISPWKKVLVNRCRTVLKQRPNASVLALSLLVFRLAFAHAGSKRQGC